VSEVDRGSAVAAVTRSMSLTLIELPCLLRHARAQRDALHREFVSLTERRKDVLNDAAARVIQAEVMILDECIRKMWVALNGDR
jgi:hypothetical protein